MDFAPSWSRREAWVWSYSGAGMEALVWSFLDPEGVAWVAIP